MTMDYIMVEVARAVRFLVSLVAPGAIVASFMECSCITCKLEAFPCIWSIIFLAARFPPGQINISLPKKVCGGGVDLRVWGTPTRDSDLRELWGCIVNG